jgi:hypothetical protein
MLTEADHLANLVTFARLEMESRDVEPWAGLLGVLWEGDVVDGEHLLWLIKLYNAYDAFDSAFAVFSRWGSPGEWLTALDRYEAAQFPCTQERRNLRGGKVVKHLEAYAMALAGGSQYGWLIHAVRGLGPERDFERLTAHLRTLWGVGRQTAFEWAEFLAKAAEFPITAPDAMLWESEGPRRSLQRLYGNPRPSAEWLDLRAVECRQMLADAGVSLSWEDFETIICDFNVGRDGRYYPGRHLAALREEIDLIGPPWKDVLMEAWYEYVPEPWCDIAPGIDKEKLTVYRDTGILLDKP